MLAHIRERSFKPALSVLNYCKDTTSGAEGLELIRNIRKFDEDLPIVFMTGRAFIALSCLLASGNFRSAAARCLLLPVNAPACFLMGSLAMLANYFPARRIVAMEPAASLRYERGYL